MQPFKIKEGFKPIVFRHNGKKYYLGNEKLQKRGLPNDIAKIISETGRIQLIKEPTDGK